MVTLTTTWILQWGTFGAVVSGTVWLGSAVGRGILPLPGQPGSTLAIAGQKQDRRVLTAARTGNRGHKAWAPALP